MGYIPIYRPNTVDYANNGLGVLTPSECTVKEICAGCYEAELIHPLDADGRWRLISNGCTVKLKVPVRENPDTDIRRKTADVIVRRDFYKPNRRLLDAVRLRAQPDKKGTILGRIYEGDEVILLEKYDVNWYKMLAPTGLSGYMEARYLTFARSEDETVSGDNQQISRRIFAPSNARDQLFRIYSVEVDSERYQVTAKAMHITYDLRANPIVKKLVYGEKTNEETSTPDEIKYGLRDPAAKNVLDECWSYLANPHPFTLHNEGITGTIPGDHSYKNFIELLLDPDEGAAAQTGSRIVRDNFDIYVLPDAEQDNHVTIMRGKNLIGVTATTDASNVVTEIVPMGKWNDDEKLGPAVQSPLADNYPFRYTKIVKYLDDVAGPSQDIITEAQFNEKLRERAMQDFDDGADKPEYTLEVDFVALGENEADPEYLKLQAVFLYDTVTVIDTLIGLKAKIRVVEYEWDALGLRYNKIKLGDIGDVTQTVYSYDMPDGSVNGNKIRANTASGNILRDMSVGYAKISSAAVNQLNANTITAYQANIEKIAAGEITADKVVAALAQITALYVEKLNAQSITADRLAAALAQFNVISAGTADFDKATVRHLISSLLNVQDAVGERVMISNLAVDYARIVSADVGSLCVRAADGDYYRLNVDSNGNVTAQKSTVTDQEVTDGITSDGRTILETNIVASQLSATGLKAVSALINRLDAARIDVGTLVAQNAFIDYLQTANIASNDSLTITLQSLRDDIQGVYRQETAPDTALPIGSLWIKPSTGALYQLTGEGMLPPGLSVTVDSGLNLHWTADGMTHTASLAEGSLVIDYSDDASVRFTLDDTQTLTAETLSWKRVRDAELEGLSQDMNQIHRYMSFTQDQGLIQRAPDSVYYTRVDEDGFDVCSDLEVDPIATMNAEDGIRARRVTIGAVSCRSTTTGGWAWQAQEE